MKNKLGRPKVGREAEKSEFVSARLTQGEIKPVETSANESHQSKSEWVRNAVISEVRRPPVWIKSKWKPEELNGKLVEFNLRSPNYRIEGVGEFLVRRNGRGEIAIDICVRKWQGPHEIAVIRYYLFQKTADKIERNPNPEIAPFRLLG
jgi:hypothetical protein